MAHHLAQPLTGARNQLGESPLWFRNRLYWVDIEGCLLISDDFSGEGLQYVPCDSRPGMLAPTHDGRLVVATHHGIRLFDPDTAQWQSVLAHPEQEMPSNRYNDGKAGPAGHLWLGSMDLLEAPGKGRFFRISPDGSDRTELNGISISNGLDWSPDLGTMYYIDSPTQQVRVFGFDPERGSRLEERAPILIGEEHGVPDGMCVDTDGRLWIAMWGGAKVIQVDPGYGTILSEIAVPAFHVTSCAFGGPDFQTLFITSARVGMNLDQLDQYPESGAVFSCRPGATGREPFRFGR